MVNLPFEGSAMLLGDKVSLLPTGTGETFELAGIFDNEVVVDHVFISSFFFFGKDVIARQLEQLGRPVLAEFWELDIMWIRPQLLTRLSSRVDWKIVGAPSDFHNFNCSASLDKTRFLYGTRSLRVVEFLVYVVETAVLGLG